MNDTNATKTLLQRLHAVMQEVDYVQKEPKKQGMQYSFVSHDAVTAKVRPLMVKHGVLYYPVDGKIEQVGNRTQMRMVVRFVNVDDGQDFIDVVTAGYGIDPGDKGPGKAISYSVKYALLKALGLETGDDPDTEQDTIFREIAYPDPPRRPSGKPQTGWREDGARTPHSLRQSNVWPELEREVMECTTPSQVNKLAFAWSQKTEVDRWPSEWRDEAREYFNARKQQLSMAPDDDVFPGDRP